MASENGSWRHCHFSVAMKCCSSHVIHASPYKADVDVRSFQSHPKNEAINLIFYHLLTISRWCACACVRCLCVCAQSATMSRDYIWAHRMTEASINREWRDEESETGKQLEYKAKINGAGQGKIITHTSDAIGLVLVKADISRNSNDQMKKNKKTKRNSKCERHMRKRGEQEWRSERNETKNCVSCTVIQ